MTSVMNKDEIQLRIDTLKATAYTNGAESTDGKWILLQENAKAKRNFPGAICLRELLGISEVAMAQQLGGRWRKQFTTETCGFINREFYGCTFLSVNVADESESSVPGWNNIINRGDIEVEAIQNLMEKIVSSSKEDGISADAGAEAVDEDAMDMEENDVTIGGSAKFLTHHGGNDLTTDNGMDVMENFDDAASFAEQSYPEESEEGKKIRDFFELCRQLAKDLAELLSFMKSQKKCNEKDFLDRLDKFLKSWDAALPDKKYFLKLHHLIFHVIEFIKQYGMYGRVSAEGFEAIHALIKKLKEMSQSQSTLNRIKTTNGKAQAVMKPQVMSATDKYTKGSTGKKRGTYKRTPSTQSTDAAESLEAYKTVTVGGEEFIEVFGGEGRIPKKYEDLWRLLTTRFVPPAWVELFQSSTTIPQDKKRKLCSTGELNLN